MRYLVTYLLIALRGNKKPTADDLKRDLGAAGASIDDNEVERVLANFKDMTLDEVLAHGRAKFHLPMDIPGHVPTLSAFEAPRPSATPHGHVDEGDSSSGDMGFDLFG